LWSVLTGSPLNILFLDDPVNSIAFSPDGLLLATGGPALTLWGVTSPGEGPAVIVPTAAPTLTPGGGIPDGNEPIFAATLPTAAPTITTAPTQQPAASAEEDSPVEGTTGATCTVTSLYDEVNVRTGPGLGYEAERMMTADESAAVNGWESDAEGFTWWQLVDGGWVRADLVQWPEICLSLPRIRQ
jgi:hypothetical protein